MHFLNLFFSLVEALALTAALPVRKHDAHSHQGAVDEERARRFDAMLHEFLRDDDSFLLRTHTFQHAPFDIKY